MIAWVLHILELIAGIFGVVVGISRLPDAASALAVVTPTAVGLVGLLAFVRHFVFHESDAKRLGWESGKPEFQYEVGFANLAFASVAFLAYFGGRGGGSSPLPPKRLARAGVQPVHDLSRHERDMIAVGLAPS